ncbi:MAG: response regulator transcription factor [Candidatus Desulfacyla sp.]
MDPIRTLIVEDYPSFRRSLKAHLEENCMAVVAGMASNGPDAVAFADELGPDLVLMKIQLPGLDGLEVCRRIKARNPNITIVL